MLRVASVAVVSVVALALAAPAGAAGLPEIKTSPENTVPECVTPGRLMAMVGARGEVDRKFAGIATEYMRHGEELNLRWDYAFFMMLVETGNLSFKTGNRNPDIRPAQNNFAGLGANGKGDVGERFPDVATGVRAHLQHVQLYGGIRVQNPVAERTRKVQEWRVLDAWQKGFKRPITFADLGRRWAPGGDSYTTSIQSAGDAFFKDFCKQADPHPEMVADARGTNTKVAVAVAAPVEPEKVSGADLARKAIVDGKADDAKTRAGLGATGLAKPTLKLLNGQPEAEAPAAAATAKAPEKTPERAPVVQTAAAAAAAKPLVSAQPPAAGQKCRVFTASYGGQKAMIIRSLADSVVNFTVLDVNEGTEKREADAFISAYAKGGAVAGEFGNQDQALEKAFELCPEG